MKRLHAVIIVGLVAATLPDALHCYGPPAKGKKPIKHVVPDQGCGPSCDHQVAPSGCGGGGDFGGGCGNVAPAPVVPSGCGGAGCGDSGCGPSGCGGSAPSGCGPSGCGPAPVAPVHSTGCSGAGCGNTGGNYGSNPFLNGGINLGPSNSLASNNIPHGEGVAPGQLQGPSHQGSVPQGPNHPGNAPQGPNYPGNAPQGPNFQGNTPQGPNFQGNAPQGPNYPGNTPQGPNYPGNAPQGPNYPGNAPQGPNFQGNKPLGGNFQGNKPDYSNNPFLSGSGVSQTSCVGSQCGTKQPDYSNNPFLTGQVQQPAAVQPSSGCNAGSVCINRRLCSNGFVNQNNIKQAKAPGARCDVNGAEICCTVTSRNDGPGGPALIHVQPSPGSSPDLIHVGPNQPAPGLIRPQPDGSAIRVTQRPILATTPFGPYTGPLNTTPHPGCAAALKCVSQEFCTWEGVMSDRPVILTREEEEGRVPLSDCQDIETGIIGKCCRDPNYKDPWPDMLPGGGCYDGTYCETMERCDNDKMAQPKATCNLAQAGSVGICCLKSGTPTNTLFQRPPGLVQQVQPAPPRPVVTGTYPNRPLNNFQQNQAAAGFANRPVIAPGYPQQVQPQNTFPNQPQQVQPGLPSRIDTKPNFPQQPGAINAFPGQSPKPNFPQQSAPGAINTYPEQSNKPVFSPEQPKPQQGSYPYPGAPQQQPKPETPFPGQPGQPQGNFPQHQQPKPQQPFPGQPGQPQGNFPAGQPQPQAPFSGQPQGNFPAGQHQQPKPQQPFPGQPGQPQGNYPSGQPQPQAPFPGQAGAPQGNFPAGQPQPQAPFPGQAGAPQGNFPAGQPKPQQPFPGQSQGSYPAGQPQPQAPFPGQPQQQPQQPFPGQHQQPKPQQPFPGQSQGSFIAGQSQQPKPQQPFPGQSQSTFPEQQTQGSYPDQTGHNIQGSGQLPGSLDKVDNGPVVIIQTTKPHTQFFQQQSPSGVTGLKHEYTPSFPLVPAQYPGLSSQINPGQRCGIRRVSQFSGLQGEDGQSVPGEFPWLTLVTLPANNSRLCAGALITDKAVLTSAHCVAGIPHSSLQVEVGSWSPYETNPERQVINVAAVARHPNFEAGSLSSDLAVLLLANPAQLGSHVDTVCIPEPNQVGSDGELINPAGACVMSSWPKQGGPQGYLHRIAMSSVPKAKCEESLRQTYLGKYFQLNRSFMCAKPVNPQHDICNVALGGPLVCPQQDGRYVITGTSSWDVGCSERKAPSVLCALDITWMNEVLTRPVEDFVQQAEDRHDTVVDASIASKKPGFSQGYGR